ncbi:MAG: hypothetical protein WAZ18_04815 [Alphaproteobacteria bacterium]
MLPQRTPSSRKDITSLPLPVLVGGGLLAFVLLVFVGVALTMGTAPEQTETVVELPLE